MNRMVAAGVVAVGLAVGAAGTALAAPNLVVNGGFEQVTSTSTVAATTAQQLARANGPNNAPLVGATATGWVNQGYNFLFTPGSADTTGSYSTEYNNYLKLWGPNNGGSGANATAGGPGALPATSPVGGNYVGADGNYQTGLIYQQIDNLTAGALYTLTFYWAAGQQAGYTGDTTESWSVYFGTSNNYQSYATQTVSTPSQGFTPWRQDTVTFTANAATQILAFLAAGTPAGVPPFSLLDGVVLTAAPEPATWLVVIAGLGGALLLRRRMRNGGGGPALAA